MAFKIMEQGRKPNTIWQTFICDTNDDVANLPTDCPAGSRAIVAQNGDLYLLDSTGAWNPMPRSGGGGGGGDDDGVFWVTYGQTTFAEIEEAYDADKLCVLKGQYEGAVLIHFTAAGDAIFARNSFNDVQEISCLNDDAWEVTIKRVDSIFFCEPDSTSFMEIVEAVIDGRLPVINDIGNGRTYYVSGYTMSGSDPVAIRFCTLEKDDSGLRYTWTVDYQDNWTSGSYTDGLYYVVPGTTTFMEIVGLLTKCTQPVINDTVNGRAYYISDYTMVGGQPAAITFSTIGANTPHTWTVDYQDNWTST